MFSDFNNVKLLGGMLEVDLFSTNDYDRLSIAGAGGDTPTLTLGGVSLAVNLAFRPAVGDTFLIVRVSESNAVVGEFPEGDAMIVSFRGRKYVFGILYNSALAGGDGNDIVLRCAADIPGGTVFVAR